MDTKAIQQLAEQLAKEQFPDDTWGRKVWSDGFEAGAAAASPLLNSAVVESPCAKKHPELYTGSYCFKCGKDYLHCPEQGFTMHDFEKGLMLAGLVAPSNEQEKAEKEALDKWEAPAPQAIPETKEALKPAIENKFDTFFGTGYWEEQYKPHIVMFAKQCCEQLASLRGKEEGERGASDRWKQELAEEAIKSIQLPDSLYNKLTIEAKNGKIIIRPKEFPKEVKEDDVASDNNSNQSK
jgi:hypothetical protein